MMVLPNTLWKGAPPQAHVTVVVRVGDAGAGGRDPTRHAHDVELDQTLAIDRVMQRGEWVDRDGLLPTP